MDAYVHNTKDIKSPGNGQADEESKGGTFAERDLSVEAQKIYDRLIGNLSLKKGDCNSFGQAYRMFNVAPNAVLGFPSIAQIRRDYGRGIAALYIFKLQHPQPGGFTHGLHIRLQGFVHRRIFEQFIREIAKSFAGEIQKMKSVVPVIKKTVSVFDYLSTLYVQPANLIVNFCHQHDAVAQAMKMQKVDTQKTSVLKNKMHNITCQIIETMTAMPSTYPQSYLSTILSSSQEEFRQHMRTTNINEIVTRVGQDAYSIALQDRTLKQHEAQELMEPMTRRAMLNRCLNERITKLVHQLIQQTFNQPFVHPHPFNCLFKSDYSQLRPLDGLIFDPRFLFSVLLTSRWFARSCMRQDDATSSNHAHLALYGGAGTGKTLIVSAIGSCVSTYKYLTGSRFQNPDMLQASLLSIEEFDTEQLLSNHYKSLLDLKCHVKIDFKNLNPENVTEGVPCMITTNDDIFTRLRTNKKYNQASVDAALRRLYIVPMKAGAFDKLHKQISKQSQYYGDVVAFESMYDKEPFKLQRIFNLILAFALYQQDIQGLYTDPRLYAYFKKISNDFASTAFGTFYLQNKRAVDQCIQEVEEMLIGLECDDASYLVRVSSSAGQFQQLIYQFLEQILDRTKLKKNILRDMTVPWSLKMYYFLNDYDFAVGLMWDSIGTSEGYMNQEIRQFLHNPTVMPYTLACGSDEQNDAMDALSSSLDIFGKDDLGIYPKDDSLIGQKRSYSQFSLCDEVLTFNKQL